MSIEAIKKALEALEQMQSALTRCMGSHKAEEGDRHRALAQGRTAITALRTAIEQAEKSNIKQVIHLYDERPAAPVQGPEFNCPRCGHCCSQRQWVGLTDAEILEVLCIWPDPDDDPDDYMEDIREARAIEAKLREKNGGQA